MYSVNADKDEDGFSNALESPLFEIDLKTSKGPASAISYDSKSTATSLFSEAVQLP
jgi:hypothetical protein